MITTGTQQIDEVFQSGKFGSDDLLPSHSQIQQLFVLKYGGVVTENMNDEEFGKFVELTGFDEAELGLTNQFGKVKIQSRSSKPKVVSVKNAVAFAQQVDEWNPSIVASYVEPNWAEMSEYEKFSRLRQKFALNNILDEWLIVFPTLRRMKSEMAEMSEKDYADIINELDAEVMSN